MALYYKVVNNTNTVYVTNQPYKEDYTERVDTYGNSQGQGIVNGRKIIIELYLDKFVLPTNSDRFFNGCINTTFNDMDKWYVSSATSVHIDNMFYNCTNLTEVDLSNGDVSHCIDMTGLFYNCSSLTSIIGPETFDLTSITYGLSNMFYNCSSLKALDLTSGTNMHSVTALSMFSGCTNIEHIIAPNPTDGSLYIGSEYSTDMFKGCTKLPNYDGVTNISRANNVNWNGYFNTPMALVTGANWDGTVLEGPVYVEKRKTPVYEGETPTRPAPSGYNHYEFSGWSPDPRDGDMTETTFTAQYQTKTTYYTVRFLRGHGSSDVLQSDELTYNVTPAYRGTMTDEKYKYGYVYRFTGGDPQISKVTQPQDYIAQYEIIIDPKVPSIYYYNGTNWELIENIYLKDGSGKQVFPLVNKNRQWVELTLHND